MIDLIPSSEEDKAFAFEAKKKGLKEYVDEMFSWNEPEEISKHNARFDKYDFWTINYESNKVGVVSYEISADTLKLNQIYVLPEFQSKGIGAECIIQLNALAKAKGLIIVLQVLLVNNRAKQFYEAMGFSEVGRSKTHFKMELR